MLVDWFTVGAQMINFIVLVGLMKRFLYQPILLAIDAREQRLSSELTSAEARALEATKERDEYRAKNSQFEQERTIHLAQVVEEASKERQRLMAETRYAAESLNAKLLANYRAEAAALNDAITQRIAQEVLEITRKALRDLASARLEEQLCSVFVERLRHVEESTRTQLATATTQAGLASARFRSAFELTSEQRATLLAEVSALFGRNVAVSFEVTKDIICGIEFSNNGQKLAWSFADYLKSLESCIGELIEQRSEALIAKPKNNASASTHDFGK
jgi:F-type H+-transporting ATPase subunit b